ncbi:hypothetical protein [Parapedobacter koreensis]|uniref:Uncharacterized protein n=1 Tax=Parapedobacter koreensis TaxID=332977 RepID=A0A1H7NKZ7_9SPHI|nr:hypothetical protein [Parapedobacter koreensis]SEL24021.1 hypothetical protein SAMN05421740_10421 [Parapedobacter koreensis]
MEITDLLEMVNNTDVLQALVGKLSSAIPVNDLMVGGSNPFIPDYSSCETPIIGIFS